MQLPFLEPRHRKCWSMSGCGFSCSSAGPPEQHAAREAGVPCCRCSCKDVVARYVQKVLHWDAVSS
eukprot:355021-Chlamydomonas_euryale.AAC.16